MAKMIRPRAQKPKPGNRWDSILTTCTVAATVALAVVVLNLYEKIQLASHKTGAPPSHFPVAERRDSEGGFCGTRKQRTTSTRAPILADFALPICVDPDL